MAIINYILKGGDVPVVISRLLGNSAIDPTAILHDCLGVINDPTTNGDVRLVFLRNTSNQKSQADKQQSDNVTLIAKTKEITRLIESIESYVGIWKGLEKCALETHTICFDNFFNKICYIEDKKQIASV